MSPIPRQENETHDENRKYSTLIFFVNGKKVVDCQPDPECTLLTYLREKLRLCGTKLGCGEGGCGACTVMVSKLNRKTNEVKNKAVNACLAPVCSMHGCAVTTIEGIGNTRSKLHPVQERIAKAHGSQCGFCTPGIVMSMYALIRNSPQPDMKDLEVAFQGNLCRCTGYRPIIEGYKFFSKEFTCGLGEKCCKNNGNLSLNGTELFDKNEFMPYNPSQESIFPPELKLFEVLDEQYLVFKGPRVTWYRPIKLTELLELKMQYPNSKIVVGNTEIGVETKFKNCLYPIIISTSNIEELNTITKTEKGVLIGASVSLTDIEEVLKTEIKDLPEWETRIYQAIVKMLHYFAGKQIRNVASLGGNIMTSSPISDLNPILTAIELEMQVGLAHLGSPLLKCVKMKSNFFPSYRKNLIEPHEILVSINIPRSTLNQYVTAYKQAKRSNDDIAIVNGAFNVIFKHGSNVIDKITLVYGGMGPTTIVAESTSKLCGGLEWNQILLEKITNSLNSEISLPPNAPGGMVAYRRSLMLSLFFKAYLHISKMLEKKKYQDINITEVEKSGAEIFETRIPKSAQLFEKVVNPAFELDPIGKPKVHLSAYKQASGEAVYCDDVPKLEGELYLSFVLSSKAHAEIISIDPSNALNLDGVHAFLSKNDLTQEGNLVGAVEFDDEIFCSGTVFWQGQIIGAIVAENQPLAQRASKMVKVVYQDLTPIIITIEDAIQRKSFMSGYPDLFVKGDTEQSFKICEHVIEGTFRVGGQEHFYLETQASIAVPRENDEIEVLAASQQPTQLQSLIARALGLPRSKVTCKAKRLGGGFGGKEPQSFYTAIPVALAAYKLGRSVRCMLDRDEDMQITGKRHPFLFKYKIGCTNDGKLLACDIEMYSNGGHTTDHSAGVMERAILTFTNSYLIPNIKISFAVCKTNIQSNTAFRGFGSPQGMLVCEHMLREVARICGREYEDVAVLNMYKDGDVTHYNQKLVNCTVQRCWAECMSQSKFHQEKENCKQFNSKNKWRKRGIAICPTTYGIGITAQFLNQGAALINIYEDGSVLLTHGGVEMGQGIHIKMIQIASRALKISSEKIHITETSTDKIPNTTATAASLGSDLNGMAVLDACNKINARLCSIKQRYPNEPWDSWIKKAYLERISLSATGFYKTPEIGYDLKTNTGVPFTYYTYGCAVSIVEIDCLTGDHQVLKTDIVMDVGSSLNPAIDIGQIEGGFTQGYGLYVLEELVYSPNGTMLSKGPGTYKLPGFANIPSEFNVSLLTGAPNPKAVYSSKAIGEPPVFLASSIFFAIRDAISSARKERGLNLSFELNSPATSARIRMACEDIFTKMVGDVDKSAFFPWSIEP